jgi:hypothetical protein
MASKPPEMKSVSPDFLSRFRQLTEKNLFPSPICGDFFIPMVSFFFIGE